jgi:putative hydrolase of the HAD superfamily
VRAGTPAGENAAGDERNRRLPAFALFLDYFGVLRQHGAIDPEILAFVRELRAAGRPVVLCSNAEGDLRDLLAEAGVDGDFDAIITSGEVGWPKPSRPFFQAACAAIDVEPRRCLLLDDTDRNVQGARAAGLVALRFTGSSDIGYARRALGL